MPSARPPHSRPWLGPTLRAGTVRGLAARIRTVLTVAALTVVVPATIGLLAAPGVAAEPGVAAAPSPELGPVVVSARVEVDHGKTRFVLDLTGRVDFQVRTEVAPNRPASNGVAPNRVVITLPPGVWLRGDTPSLGAGAILRFHGERQGDGKDGVVLETDGPVRAHAAYQRRAGTDQHGVRLVVDLQATAAVGRAPTGALGNGPVGASGNTPGKAPGNAAARASAARAESVAPPALVFPPPKDSPLTLLDALARTYQDNPDLNAARQKLKAADEQVPQALAGYRPQVTVTGNAGRTWDDSRQKAVSAFLGQVIGPPATTLYATSVVQKQGAVNLVQPLYRADLAPSVRQAENLVLAQRASLKVDEQLALLSAAVSYFSVWQSQEVLKLLRDNETSLVGQVQIIRNRFTYGEVSQTDVLQSESRASKATGDRANAESSLRAATATFAQVVGVTPGRLKEPVVPWQLPRTEDEAIDLAIKNNPNVVNAHFSEVAARDSIDIIDGKRYPILQLLGSALRTTSRDVTFSTANTGTPYINRDTSFQLMAQLVIPLYSGGTLSSQYRQAYQTAGQYRLQTDSTRDQVVALVRTSWDALLASRSSIAAHRAAVVAAEQAVEGVGNEAAAGFRSNYEVLVAQQDIVDAETALIGDEFNEWSARATLLTAIGRFGAADLKLPVRLFDETKYYSAVKDRWFDEDVGE